MSPCGADRRRQPVNGKSGQIAAGDLPFVVLLGEDCPDEPADRSPVRENANDVGASSHLLVEAGWKEWRQICQSPLQEGTESLC